MLRKTGVRPKGAERVLADTEFGVQFFENANERLGWSFERALGQLTHLLYSPNVVRHQHIALPLTANHLSGIFDPTKAKFLSIKGFHGPKHGQSLVQAIKLKGNYGSHTLRKTWGYHQRVTYKVDIPSELRGA
jgi:hypothetical protein